MTTVGIVGGRDAAGRPQDVLIVDGLQVDPHRGTATPGATLDASGLTVLPGFIDLQINGGIGYDFTEDPASMWTVGSWLPSTGVTSFCPTIITAPPERTDAAHAAIASRPMGYRGAEPLGLHLEGPFLAPDMRGTHPARWLRTPEQANVRTTDVAIVTIAPELPGAIDLIRTLSSAGVVVSIGHSAASAAEASAAIDAGATLGTHVFNAMPPISGRDPGIAAVLLTDERSRLELISDGHHLDAATIRLAWRTAPGRIVVVTDATAAAGKPDGTYQIGGVPVTVVDRQVRNADGRLAGAATTMDVALGMLADALGRPFADVSVAATKHPAAALGRTDIGILAQGARGDVVLVEDRNVVATLVGGSIAHLRDPGRLTTET